MSTRTTPPPWEDNYTPVARSGDTEMNTVSFGSMELEDQTIKLQRFSSLALHYAIEYDARDHADISRLAHVTELLAEGVEELVRWLEKNGTSSTRRAA
jgi:hypothetical protein